MEWFLIILLSFPDNTGSDYKYKSHLVDSETITFSNTVPPAQDFSVYYRQTIHILVPLRVIQFPATTSHNMDWSDLGKILPAVFLFCSPFFAFVLEAHTQVLLLSALLSLLLLEKMRHYISYLIP